MRRITQDEGFFGLEGGDPLSPDLPVSEFSPIKDGFVIPSVELVSNNC